MNIVTSLQHIIEERSVIQHYRINIQKIICVLKSHLEIYDTRKRVDDKHISICKQRTASFLGRHGTFPCCTSAAADIDFNLSDRSRHVPQLKVFLSIHISLNHLEHARTENRLRGGADY